MSAEDRRKCPYLKGFRALKGVSIRKVTIGCITQKIIGKDEVGGSNPPSSSTKTALFSRKGRFYFVFHDFLACLEFWIRALTTEQATDRKNQCSGGIEPPEHCAFQPVFAFLAAISCFISWIGWASFSSHSSYVLAYTFRAMRFPLTTGEYRPSQRFSLIWLTQPVPGLRRWPL